MKCPHKNIHKKTSRGAIGEALASQFELDFTLIACMAITMMGSVWYLESGASFHMLGNKYSFSDLQEKHLQMQVKMGYHGRYIVTGIGVVTF